MDKNDNVQKLIRRISLLENDLLARIVIQEEEGYWGEPNRSCHSGERGEYGTDEKGWHVTVPGIYEIDIPKREAAASGLKQLYNTSEWYFARYQAGLALALPKDQLEADRQK